MGWFSKHHDKESDTVPPAWAPATEESRTWGLVNEASEDDFEAGERFCARNPQETPKYLASHDVERIYLTEGYKVWGLVKPTIPRFKGSIKDICSSTGRGPKVIEVSTSIDCGDSCILSNFPILGGLYDIGGKSGVYFEVTILQMNGTVAIGTACRPYPEFRLPGWNRLSAALHLDDLQKFWEDPCGGRSYDTRLTTIVEGDVIGCGYDFAARSLFYTLNGERLNDAFRGIYTPRDKYDVYAAIGVCGPGTNRLRVNFGGCDEANLFRWKPGREWTWRVEGHVGRMGETGPEGDALPSYSQAV